MKFLPLAILLLLSSCVTFKLPTSEDIHQVVIKDKWSPIDFYELKTYPIKDTNSWAIGFMELGSDKLIYARDKFGEIYENYSIGDTIPVTFLGIHNK